MDSMRRSRRILAASLLAAAALLRATPSAAFPPADCAGERFGADLNCTANDVQITEMTVTNGPSFCSGGGTVTLDLLLTVNFGSPNRWDVGIFISNDGADPQLTVSNGGAAACSVAVLPNASPFLDLDPNGGTDTCGDGNGTIGGGTGSGQLTMTNVTVPCQALGNNGLLYIPFVVSWDNQASPTGATCTSNADPVPNTKSKCNAPTIEQGSVAVAVLPTITKSDGVAVATPGDPTTYSIVLTNNTGITLSTGNANAAIFRDPAVVNLTATGVTCSASGGASCPGSPTVAAMQSLAGITIPSMPNGSSVTFSVTASVNGGTAAGASIVNTAQVSLTGGSAVNSVSDTNTVVYPSLVHRKTVAVVSDPVNGTTRPKSIPGAVEEYTLRLTNSGQGTADTDAVSIVDSIPANTELFVGDLGGAGSGPVAFTQGSPTSALSYTFTSLASNTDDLEFSNDGGASFNYVPSGSYDPNVTHVRISPNGRMAANTGSGNPYFELRLRVRVK
jgi:hypothetical protein